VSYLPEFCFQKHEEPEGCRHPKQIWDGLIIHGLWPDNDDGSYPQNCTNEKFDLSSLQPIRDELEQQWPNIKALANSTAHGDFWEHEWSKHGTCTGLSQLDYFSHALKKMIPTPSIVKDAEARHSFVTKDDLLKFYDGVQRAVLVCNRGYLSEVWVCHRKETDGNVGERMDCPQAIMRASSCGKTIRIASFVNGQEEE
jgi:ribonuclease T2